MGQRLRSAMLRAQLDSAGLAAAVGVDVKTVNLWPQTRPDLNAGASATAEVLGAFGHRADMPSELWVSLLLGATDQIDLVGYAYPFVLELLPNATDIIATKCRSGTRTRLAFADPDCAHVIERDNLEQMHGTLSGRIRNALSLLGELTVVPECRIGLHSTHLYNSVFRFDDQMIVTPYLVRARGYQHPALHLRRLSPHGIFASFADQVEQIWETVTPYRQGGADKRTA